MKKQKITAIALACVLVLGMTGCGNNKAKSYSKYVELGEYKGIEYTKEVAEVTDDDIQQRLDSFVSGLAEDEEITDRAVEDGDIVNIDYVGTMDGEEFDGGTASGQDLTIGSGLFIPGFENGLVGHNIGEKVSLDLQFPDPYENNPDFAGKEVNFAVTINSIKVTSTPELTDALVKENTDFDTIDAYKESIRAELAETNENSAEQQAQNDIFTKVMDSCKITGYDEAEVKELVDQEFESFRQSAETYVNYGYSYEDVLAANGYQTEDELKEGITEYIKSYLNQKMVMYCIADKEGIKATSEETDKMVQEYMDTYQVQTKEEVYEYFGDDYFAFRVLADKVMEFLKDNAVLVDSTEESSEAEAGENSEEEKSEETSEEEETESEGEAATEEKAEEE
ncbi:MAG: trigger factor [Clostridium sp.]|nr:trigger factor [Clostridium sp.]